MHLPEPTIIDCEQGTDEWHQARAGLVTASGLPKVLSNGKGNQPSKTRLSYMYQLIAEQILGGPYDTYQNEAMRRGHRMEPYARADYELLTGNPVTQTGFIKRGLVGYSPDGMVGDDGGIEIKSMLPHILVETHLRGSFPAEHWAQIHGGMWIADLQWIDFVGYWPDMDPYIERVYRDEDAIKEIETAVESFLEEMSENLERLTGEPLAIEPETEPAITEGPATENVAALF